MFYDPMIAKLITWAPTRDRGDRRAGRRARPVRDRRHQRQCRFPLGADAAPALPLGRHHHRLHRRGISRRLRGRAGRRAADRRPGGDRRHGRGRSPTSAPPRSATSSAPPPHFPCERVVRIDGGAEHTVRIKPYKGGTLAVLDDGDLMRHRRALGAGAAAADGARRRPKRDGAGPPRRPRLGASDPRRQP